VSRPKPRHIVVFLKVVGAVPTETASRKPESCSKLKTSQLSIVWKRKIFNHEVELYDAFILAFDLFH
jgi:hypothetical protein